MKETHEQAEHIGHSIAVDFYFHVQSKSKIKLAETLEKYYVKNGEDGEYF